MSDTVIMETPIGTLEVSASETGIDGIRTVTGKARPSVGVSAPRLRQCVDELNRYFEGRSHAFASALDMNAGTAFQRSVWNAIRKIPAGSTLTYAQVASKIGRPKAARAVGNALNKNPVMIAVPCHRVVGANGPGGFACGLKAKKWLLDHEKRVSSS